jgi:RimJ/RimL family protein N-acetyltransferase
MCAGIYVGVATRFQGQGLGAALLRPTLDRCDREGLPAYLEASSERSAALYERLGFVHLGELRVPDGPGSGRCDGHQRLSPRTHPLRAGNKKSVSLGGANLDQP